MDRQTEITTPGALLNEKGDLARPGFSRALVQKYRRADVKVSPLRIKEWDYYLVNNGKFALALTVADNGYMGLDSVSLLDLEEGWEITKSPMSFLPLGKKHLPETSVTGDVHSAARGYGIHFIHEGEKRVLIAYMNKFGESALSARVELTECPEDSLVIATPFDKPGHFYYNQKIVGFRASGYVNYNGKTYTFEPSDSFAVLDWGRGVWTYENTWYWSSAAYVLPSGTPFGWNLGYGFGDTSAASENMLFHAGTAHKLGGIKFEIPGEDEGKERYTEPWKFTSDDGRFEADFVPVLDRASCADAKLITGCGLKPCENATGSPERFSAARRLSLMADLSPRVTAAARGASSGPKAAEMPSRRAWAHRAGQCRRGTVSARSACGGSLQ